jgi:Ner family transcriptional regulator
MCWHDAITSNRDWVVIVPDWHPEDIKAAVRKRGVTLAQIARSVNIPGNAFRLALTLPRADAERALARVLDVHPKVIWPSRYHPDGSRKRPQPVDNYAVRPRFANHGARA